MKRTELKQRYNKEHYSQVKVDVAPELAKQFKNECRINNHSQALVLSVAMRKYAIQSKTTNDFSGKFFKDALNEFTNENSLKFLNALNEKIIKMMNPPAPTFGTLVKRKKAIAGILEQLEQIRDVEQECVENIPDNMAQSEYANNALERFNTLDDFINQLREVYFL